MPETFTLNTAAPAALPEAPALPPLDDTEPPEAPAPLEEVDPLDAPAPLEEADPLDAPVPLEEADPPEAPVPLEEADPLVDPALPEDPGVNESALPGEAAEPAAAAPVPPVAAPPAVADAALLPLVTPDALATLGSVEAAVALPDEDEPSPHAETANKMMQTAAQRSVFVRIKRSPPSTLDEYVDDGY